jgi:hypothetical protein
MDIQSNEGLIHLVSETENVDHEATIEKNRVAVDVRHQFQRSISATEVFTQLFVKRLIFPGDRLRPNFFSPRITTLQHEDEF